MIGRTLPQIGIGNPWWTFVEIVRTEAEAVGLALTLAARENARVWIQAEPGRFRLAEPTFS